MRIIAGDLGGRRIRAPEGDGTRPMLDRVREAVFARIEGRLPEARVLDLFAGSGSLGLEALSRGAAHVRFVERGKEALEALTRNVQDLGVAQRVRIWRGDALRAESWRDRRAEEPPYDVVFFDPPYKLVTNPDTSPLLVRALQALVRDHVAPGGVVVVHAPARDVGALRPGPDWGFDLREYGGSGIALVTAPPGG
ncbi:MAG: 16S rRNA (guanine(966)-N(2))-methyltransferase RsmD [Planctomycetes bacterium]|nr:16S rRNA (guanine(966)-N(2))-methyltransferase RsmD [Planctomycetota bacterium]